MVQIALFYAANFGDDLPNLLYLLLSLIVMIPAVHVWGHQEFCWYVYGGTYTQSISHFFGETGEFVSVSWMTPG